MTSNKKSIFKLISLLLIVVMIYSAIIEPNLLIIKKFNINEEGTIIEKETEDEYTKFFKIVHISDTQIGYFYSANRLKNLVKKINNLTPDIVVFTGDLIDYANKNPNIDKITEYLSKIDAKIGKFAVFGNHDYMYDLPKYYTQIMQNSGFNLLVNKNKRIELENEKYINIIGLDEKLHGKPLIKAYDEDMDDKDFNLVLMHNPDVIEEFKNSKIDLMLSGHSHGGQVSIPIKGAILTPPYGRKYTKGFYKVNGNNLFVTSGLGSTKLPFRLLNVPEIVEFNIILK